MHFDWAVHRRVHGAILSEDALYSSMHSFCARTADCSSAPRDRSAQIAGGVCVTRTVVQPRELLKLSVWKSAWSAFMTISSSQHKHSLVSEQSRLPGRQPIDGEAAARCALYASIRNGIGTRSSSCGRPRRPGLPPRLRGRSSVMTDVTERIALRPDDDRRRIRRQH